MFEVEQALHRVLREERGVRLGLEDQLLDAIGDQEVDSTFPQDDALVADGDLDLPLELEPMLGEGELERPLVIHFHQVASKLLLHVDARPNDPMTRCDNSSN